MLTYAGACWSQVINIVIVLCVVILICASLAVQVRESRMHMLCYCVRPYATHALLLNDTVA
jgi:hypothetical protein